MTTRRDFISKTVLGGAALLAGSSVMGMSASSYRRIIGSNDRLNVAIAGLGRRLGAYYEPVSLASSNARLMYLCDVMESQRERSMQEFSNYIDYKPQLENDIRKVLDDKEVDLLINATPDHWHTPGSIMAMQAGKNVYVEKPSSHNMWENELLVEATSKYGKVVQMGNQQRSSGHTIEIMKEIHDGVIGSPYKAIAFYTNSRGEVPAQEKTAVPQGLDWELFQGPAPRREYTRETWDYNWHWYGWDYGTAEAGNNGTHEIDIARWALQVDYPKHVQVEAAKRHFKDDGWEMYDSMLATFKFEDDKIIQWDGQSRNGYETYGAGRGTIIFGTEGSVFVDREGYVLKDRSGNVIRQSNSASNEAGTALGGGGDMSTAHMINFFDAIRGKADLTAPIDDANISMAMVHYSNMGYRAGRDFQVDQKSGKVLNDEVMKFWSRKYAPGWKPEV